MTTYEDLFPSRYLKANDINGADLVLVMDYIVQEKLGHGSQAEDKPVLYFKDNDKVLVLNVTNGKTIKELYGNNVEDWSGKPIALFPTEVQFGSETVMGVRIRSTKPELQQESEQEEFPF